VGAAQFVQVTGAHDAFGIAVVGYFIPHFTMPKPVYAVVLLLLPDPRQKVIPAKTGPVHAIVIKEGPLVVTPLII
jgi:hypothetical protein